jgi:micrococcal nuclease
MLGTLLVCATLIAVDGDTIKCNGVNMRDLGDGAPNVSGYDTPETHRPKCDRELQLGEMATRRMTELLGHALVYASGSVDRYDRPLVWVRLPDGRSVGSVLIAEGLAAKWTPAYHADWCH